MILLMQVKLRCNKCIFFIHVLCRLFESDKNQKSYTVFCILVNFMLQYSEFLELQIQSAKMPNRSHFLVEVKSRVLILKVKELHVLKEEYLSFLKSRTEIRSFSKNVLFSRQRQRYLSAVL